EPITKSIVASLPITLELAFLAIVMSVVVAIPLGVLSAIKRNSRTDFWARAAGLIGLAFPNFWLATMFLLLTSVLLHWVPPVIWIQLGGLIGGSVIIEQIFGLPGIGWSLLQGIFGRDYPVVQVSALFLATVFVVVNLLVDLTYAYLDPRIKYS